MIELTVQCVEAPKTALHALSGGRLWIFLQLLLAEPFQPKTQKDAAGYKKIGNKKTKKNFSPVFTSNNKKENQIRSL